MTKEIKGIIKMVASAILVAFAVVGVINMFNVKLLDYKDIELVAVNGNTNNEYILRIGDEEYYKQNDFDYYYAQNQNLS